jgi:hypothetical protein
MLKDKHKSQYAIADLNKPPEIEMKVILPFLQLSAVTKSKPKKRSNGSKNTPQSSSRKKILHVTQVPRTPFFSGPS